MDLALDYVFTVVGGFVGGLFLLKGIGWIKDRGVDRENAEVLHYVKFYSRDELGKMLRHEYRENSSIRDAFSTRRIDLIKRALEIVDNIQTGGRGGV